MTLSILVSNMQLEIQFEQGALWLTQLQVG